MVRFIPLLSIVAIATGFVIANNGFNASTKTEDFDPCDERYTICIYELRNVDRDSI